MTAANGRRWRQRVVRRLPVALMEYPFETFMALLGLLVGAALLFGTIRPGSLFEALPFPAIMTYAVATAAGAGTVLAGLIPARKHPIPMAIGLRLLAALFLAYGGAILYFAGVSVGGMSGFAFVGLSALAGFRSMYLRAQAETAALLIHREG